MSSEESSVPKQSRLHSILLGEAFLNVPPPDETALARVAKRASPSSLIFNNGTLVFLPLVAGVGACTVLALNYIQKNVLPIYPNLKPHLFPLVGCAGFFAGAILYLLLYIVREAIVKNLFATLLQPVEELHGIEEYLNNFVADMDRRMSGIFHCVTNTKVTHYFIIQQIRDAVTVTLQEIESCYDKLTVRSFFEAYHLLAGGVSVSDGVIAESGEIFQVPFSSLEQSLAMLIEDLERGLRGLEADLAQARSSYTTPGPTNLQDRTSKESH
jgi:hypothetical protein